MAGITDDDISHIEIGCGCSREHQLLQKIATLRMRAQELNVKLKLAMRGGLDSAVAEEADEAIVVFPMTRDAALFERAKEELKAAREELESFRGDEMPPGGPKRREKAPKRKNT